MLKSKYSSLYFLILASCSVELALSLNDLFSIGPDRARRLVYDYGAFWPGLLQDWTPNYTAQPYVMFVTYALLHGGLLHLCVNMITLYSLGRTVLDQVDHAKFLLLYFGTSLSGALGFALLAPTLRPMVGASGSLFGLLGALVAWRYLDRMSNREGLKDVARVVLILIALNLVLWWSMNGQLAWETHLGGFLGGWIGALLIDYYQQSERA
jgi:membrane associated rhomboid family serine protease